MDPKNYEGYKKAKKLKDLRLANEMWFESTRLVLLFSPIREIYTYSYEKEKITSIGRGQAVTSIKCGAGLSPVILFLFFSRYKHMLLWKL